MNLTSPSNPADNIPPSQEDLAKVSIFTPKALAHRVAQSGTAQYLIENLIPKQGISLVVGDSGLGKSPWLYQAAICVAAGVPFLGHAVSRPARVLWMDCENSISQVQEMICDITFHLQLPEVPENLLCWNQNDCETDYRLENLIQAAKPDWVIIDPLRTIKEGCGGDNLAVTAAYKHLREIMGAHRCTITGVHHIRKPQGEQAAYPLELAPNPNDWFLQALGARTLITGCDVRIGIDHSSQPEADMIVRGFARTTGEFPPILVARVRDLETGEPIAYRRLKGIDLLSSRDREVLASLPDRFRYKDVQQAFPSSSSNAANFLKDCQAKVVIRKLPGREGYEKTSAVPVALAMAA